MIPNENRNLINAIQAPEEHAEVISLLIEKCREYGKQRGYSPFVWKAVTNSRYFCAYKQGGAARGEGLAIVGFENRGDELWLVFHHVVVDLKGLTIQTATDKENRWRRVHINRVFSVEEIQYISKLCYQCFDKVFR